MMPVIYILVLSNNERGIQMANTIPIPPLMSRGQASTVVTDEMLKYWFKGTNFGCDPTAENQRRLLANGLLKHQAGWYNGHTMQQAIKNHSLVNKRGNINKRGRMFIWEYFKNHNVSTPTGE
jgi:hypothetical protein